MTVDKKNSLLHTNLYELRLEDLRKNKRRGVLLRFYQLPLI